MTDFALIAAISDTVGYAQRVDLPLQDIAVRGGSAEALKVTFLFQRMESYGVVMNDTTKKDAIIEAFMHSLTVNHYDFGDHPRISFSFSVAI